MFMLGETLELIRSWNRAKVKTFGFILDYPLTWREGDGLWIFWMNLYSKLFHTNRGQVSCLLFWSGLHELSPLGHWATYDSDCALPLLGTFMGCLWIPLLSMEHSGFRVIDQVVPQLSQLSRTCSYVTLNDCTYCFYVQLESESAWL